MTFHKIDKDSHNTITSALSFFEVPPTNVSVSSSAYKGMILKNIYQIKLFRIFATKSNH